jgi:hypothetical protein
LEVKPPRRSIPHPNYFPVIPKGKVDLADLLLSQASYKTSLEGVIRTIPKDEFADVIWQWMDRCKQSVSINSD